MRSGATSSTTVLPGIKEVREGGDLQWRISMGWVMGCTFKTGAVPVLCRWNKICPLFWLFREETS